MTTDEEEQAYMRGGRSARTLMIAECLRWLDADDPLKAAAAAVVERERTIAALRDICAEFGDNDWPNDLALEDVIEKHLARHLRE